jgi:glycerophosphoryl diester phosphodiesterase
VFVNIDVKDDLPDAAVATLRVVRDRRAEDRVGLGSFHVGVAAALRAAGWSGQLALVPREVAAVRLLPVFVARRLVGGTAAQIPTHRGRFRLDAPWFVARCHALGLRVDYWTIDDPAEARALVAAGADGIVTNDPAAIAAALR